MQVPVLRGHERWWRKVAFTKHKFSHLLCALCSWWKKARSSRGCFRAASWCLKPHEKNPTRFSAWTQNTPPPSLSNLCVWRGANANLRFCKAQHRCSHSLSLPCYFQTWSAWKGSLGQKRKRQCWVRRCGKTWLVAFQGMRCSFQSHIGGCTVK